MGLPRQEGPCAETTDLDTGSCREAPKESCVKPLVLLDPDLLSRPFGSQFTREQTRAQVAIPRKLFPDNGVTK